MVDGSTSEVEAMIADTGVGTFTHLTGSDAHALASEHGVSSIPHFAFIDGDGSADALVGWSEGQFVAKLEALRS